MADPRGFLTNRERELPANRPVSVRLMDWKEVHEHRTNHGEDAPLHRQASRCMDCGVPFCHNGCPLGNLIPEWNDLVWRGQWADAIERLHATNNFPEFTGRICPAPCEDACVLGINQPAVTIKNIEVAIIDEAFERDLVQPVLPQRLTGNTVAVVGSGPAGLAAAQQLTRAGHTVAVFEKDDRAGGLLRYGVPDFKLEKHLIDRRLAQLEAEGTRFRLGVEVGRDITWGQLRSRYDAVVITTGASVPRGLNVPGTELNGVHPAMTYLTQANRAAAGLEVTDQITAAGKHVVVIGGGDTGSDCIGTAWRQGAASVTNLAIGKRPPTTRSKSDPWPTTPRIFEVSTSHQEGGEREFLASTVALLSDDDAPETLKTLRMATTEYLADGRRVPQAGTERELPADLVLVAMGFTGPQTDTVSDQLQLRISRTGAIWRDTSYQTSLPGVFVAGDAGRGQSLIVWAIAEGRAAAAAVDKYFLGQSTLPTPVFPSTVVLRP